MREYEYSGLGPENTTHQENLFRGKRREKPA
jgi:hypothetical protein